MSSWLCSQDTAWYVALIASPDQTEKRMWDGRVAGSMAPCEEHMFAERLSLPNLTLSTINQQHQNDEGEETLEVVVRRGP